MLATPNALESSMWAISAFAAVHLQRPRIAASAAEAEGVTKTLVHRDAEVANTAAADACDPRRLSNSLQGERNRFQPPLPQSWSVSPRSASWTEVVAPPDVQNAEEARGQNTQNALNASCGGAAAAAALARVVKLLAGEL